MAAASATLIAFPELVEATTSTIFAPGAIAWAYCTSKLVSTLQPASSWCLSLGAKTGHPSGHRIVKDGGAGTWNSASNVARSCATVGLGPGESGVQPQPSAVRMSAAGTPDDNLMWPSFQDLERVTKVGALERGAIVGNMKRP